MGRRLATSKPEQVKGNFTLRSWRIGLNGFAVAGASLAGRSDRGYFFEAGIDVSVALAEDDLDD
jgi:hypothetical protein